MNCDLRIAVIIAAGLALMIGTPSRAGLSVEPFHNPPAQARPSALWAWLNGHVEHKQITRELEEMKSKGMRGAIIWDVGSIADPTKMIPAGPRFLGAESLQSIHHAMDEAQRLGLEIGLFASSSWNAGGTWITPDDASKALLWSELKLDGPREFSDVLPLPEKVTAHHEDVAVVAIPDGSNKTVTAPLVRLESHLTNEGRLTWRVPAGTWRVLRFVRNNTEEYLNCPSPNSKGLVIDHLSRAATDAHIIHILDKLREGRDGYGSLKLLMLDSYEVRPGIDWTPDLIDQFKMGNGYDPVPWLPVLAGWTVTDAEKSTRFRHDYQKLVSDLMIENHFARSRDLLNQRGLQLLAEGGHGGYARVDPLKALGAADIPMGEFWNHRKNWVVKEAASAGHIYGKTIVNAESFTGWQNWQDGPAAYKRLLDIALCAGLNQVTFHTFSHNPSEAGLPGFAYHAGEHFNVNNTWWQHAGPMIEDMSRACHLLQQGRFVADVCVYYGDEAPNLVPARRIAPTIKSQWSDDQCAHCGREKPVNLDSLGQGYDYDYINEEVILTRMQVRDGLLVLPDGMSYRMMVLPDRKTISPAVLKRIGELVEAGATIVGPKPERSNSLRDYPGCDDAVNELAGRIWGDSDGDRVKTRSFGKGKVIGNLPLHKVLGDMGVGPDFIAEGIENDNRKIDYIHRKTDDEDIYFVSNSTMKHQAVSCHFRVDAERIPSFWHTEDGSVRPCYVYETKGGYTRLTLDLSPASSVFVVFAKSERRDHLVEIQRTDDAGTRAHRLEMEALNMTGSQLAANIWQPGIYQFKTAAGRTGKIRVDEVPADQPIEGPWRVSFPAGRGAPAEIAMPSLTDWTASPDPGVRYFSGSATYHHHFTLPATFSSHSSPLILDLGSVKEVAVVRVNGQQAGVLWKQPYRIDISRVARPGENKLEIEVVNTWNNRIVGDLRSESQTRITRTNLISKFNANSPLLSSGLLGPVSLKCPVVVSCDLK